MRRFSSVLALLTVLLISAPRTALYAQLPPELPGTIEQLPQPPSPHWVWVSDLVLERISLIDLDSGRFLGMVNAGYGPFLPLFSHRRHEVYIPATYFTRRWHGERTDVLEIHDTRTLAFRSDVVLPPKRATNAVALGHAAISDDERFVAIFNWTTGTGLTIVDAEKRAVTAEITTPGCSLVYAAGPRRFFSICADGAIFVLTLDDEGREAARQQLPPFHDPRHDPVTEKAVRAGNEWLFVSFEGRVHGIDVGGAELASREPWALLTETDRRESWRVGGLQHLAVHAASGRLYSLVHKGGPGSHKEPGEEVWVYDLARRQRVQRIVLRNPGLTIYGFPIEIGSEWPWPFNRLAGWAVDRFVPPLVSHIQVTADDQPLLITAAQFSGALGIYDATDGRFLRRVQPTGWMTDLLVAPWDGKVSP